MRSGISGLAFQCRKRLVSSRSLRCFSDSGGPQPLFLWLGESNNPEAPKSSLLLPVPKPLEPTVLTPEEVLQSVNSYYEAETQFVGGMGEDDPGVWFASINFDPLDYSEMVQDSISLVKEERHGVPFSLFTSGLVSPNVPLAELGLSSLHVSLYAGSPKEYAKASSNSERDFGTLCGFIVEAAEQGIAVETWVLEEFAGGARDLALSLGAQNVNVVAGSR
jgi:hypothetical protein